MTGEEFRTRYQLGERLTGPPVVTVRAIGPSGLPVLVHYLVGDEETDSRTILTRASHVEGPAREKIREIDEVDGVPVVVSEPLPDFNTFMDWVGGRPGPDGPVPEGPADASGTYTQLFKTPPVEGDADAPTPGATGQEGGVSPPSETKGKAPGAYTMLFGRAAGEPPAAPAETPAEETAAREEAPTDAFPKAPPPSEQPGKPEKKDGSYTMLFGGGAPGDRKAPETSGPTRPPPTSEPTERETDTTVGPTPAGGGTPSGSYTRLFGGGAEKSGGTGDPGPEPPSPPPSIPREEAEPAAGPSRKDFPGPEEHEEEGIAPPNVVFPTIPTASSPPEEEAAGPGLRPAPGDQAPSMAHPPPEERPGTGQSAPPPPPPQEEAPRPPGAYTRIFGGQRTADGSRREPPPASEVKDWRPPPVAHPPQGEPQDSSGPAWQRWKESPGASGGHIPSDDYLQRLREPSGGNLDAGGHREPPGGGPASGPPVAEPFFSGGEAQRQGPGHYTMVRKGLVASPTPGSPKPPSSQSPTPQVPEGTPASAPSRKSRTLTILGLVAVLLAAVAIVVVFALTS